MTRALSVLVIEDDARLREILVRHLERLGYAVRDAPGAGRALQLLEEAPADVVLSDVRMPGIDGRTLLQLARERFPAVRVVLMTAFGSVDDAVEAMRAGAYSYVTKPFRVEELAGVLRNAAREVALGREVEGLRRAARGRFSADRLVGQSGRMQQVRAQLREAARVGSTVLLTGRSGTGKEMAARAIHGEGPRAGGPFVPVNCAAIPEQLFESAMFGHVKGAFTGAHESRPGFLERSSGGTLFLDEVGEIPPSLQPKLLRALQEGEVLPVGATRPVTLDLRVVAATNRDLASMVRDGSFREDLYYRLDVLRVELPALAERAEDVPPLAEHLLLEIADEQGAASLGITARALAALARRPWPGNVRELRNVLERALLSSAGRAVDLADLPPDAGPVGPDRTAAGTAPAAGLVTLEELERTHVERVLAAVGWNRSAAARILGIDRRTLFTKIQRYGLIGPLRAGPSSGPGEDG